MNYYNEIDPYCVEWLQNLVLAGLIPPGKIDIRPIEQVHPNDLKGFTQCHFFCGIGGWIRALQLAGWPEDREIWTGSCPCQPFSVAGKSGGEEDERHLWPFWERLIWAREPAKVAGEQVASKSGREWLAGVRVDLGELGYEVGAVDLPSACVGAQHIRQRLWWVADSSSTRLAGSVRERSGVRVQPQETPTKRSHPSVSKGLFNVPHPRHLPSPYGIPRPVGQVRAYGNSIVPQVAAEILKAWMSARL